MIAPIRNGTEVGEGARRGYFGTFGGLEAGIWGI